MSASFFFGHAEFDLGLGRGDHVHFEKILVLHIFRLKNMRDARGLARARAALLSNRKGQSPSAIG